MSVIGLLVRITGRDQNARDAVTNDVIATFDPG
jgi:hypothetical protein